MASLQATLNRAMSHMAYGPQSNVQVVAAVVEAIESVHSGFVRTDKAKKLASLRPIQLRLLWAAGWLLPCFIAPSGLSRTLQAKARSAWTSCMTMATRLLTDAPPTDLPGFLSLMQGCGSPQIQSVLKWTDQLAVQLEPDMGQWTDTQRELAGHAILLWQALVRGMKVIAPGPEYASILLQPGLLRLHQQLALRPPPPSTPAAAAAGSPLDALRPPALLDNLEVVTGMCGALLEVQWREKMLDLFSGGGAAGAKYFASSSSSSSSQNPMGGPTLIQMAMVVGQEAFWWGGVAVLSGRIRAGGSTSRTTSNKAAELCPSYHAGAAWRVATREGTQGGSFSTRWGRACLQHLLLREAAGSHPWVLQQLRSHRAAQKAATSSSSALEGLNPFLGIQWPLVWGSYSRRTNAITTSSSRGCQCRDSSPTCYLCTPPPPVTLQQLRLVLEMVCLTCRECSPEALQAPLLLALLLQRASPDLRAAFLNSADGVRLLAALQQTAHMCDPPPAGRTKVSSWCMYDHKGTLSGELSEAQVPWKVLPPAASRAVFTLSWCFLEPDTGPGTPLPASTSAAGGGVKAGGEAAATLVTPEAVAHGAVLLCVGKDDWEACVHLLRLPFTSLRLAAGVVPSLALFATLEGLLRRCLLNDAPVLLTMTQAAVQGLLQPESSDGCGCSQHQTMAATGTSSSSATSTSTASATTTSTTTTTGSSNSSRSGSHGPGCSVLVPSEVLAAVSSTAVSISKLVMKQNKPADTGAGARRTVEPLRELILLGTRVSYVVLQLALQQLHHHETPHQQPSPQEAGRSWALMQLVQGAQCLLRQSAIAAAMAVEKDSRQAMTATVAWSNPNPIGGLIGSLLNAAVRQTVADINSGAEEHSDNSQRLLIQLHTANQRLVALHRAAATQLRATGDSAEGSAAPAAATASRGAAWRAAPAPVGNLSWCPAHSSSPSPAALRDAQGPVLSDWYGRISAVTDQVHLSVGFPLWLTSCNFVHCRNSGGPSDAALVTGCRGVVCSGCGVARFCSPGCASKAWPDHRKVCGRLAAALGRPGASSRSSSRTHRTTTTTSSSSSTSRVVKPGAAGGGGVGGQQAAAAERGAAPSNSSSSSTRDTTPVRDQGAAGPPAPAGVRACAWCGVTPHKLLCCGRCKAAWYCGVDHQRAAWKAGHKQECGTAAAAVVAGRGCC